MTVSEVEKTNLWHHMTAIARRMERVDLIRGIQRGYVLMVAGAVMLGFSDFLLHLPVPGYEAWLVSGGPQTDFLYRPLHVIYGGITNFGSLFLGMTIMSASSSASAFSAGAGMSSPISSGRVPLSAPTAMTMWRRPMSR